MRSRLIFSIDEEQKRITVRYIGDISGNEIVTELTKHLESVGDVWLYDMTFDMRRFEGFVPFEELARLAKHWATIAQGRDVGRKVAIVSNDPLVLARANAYSIEFPTRSFRIFQDMADADLWLDGELTESAAKLVS
ncbi:STAS/SEC14 domain-containing protein [Asticcacaulis sp. YBE204]|uniref:STAS/SEC14 domain-containing protein n=1 Tax=Asticcacaulis sp. YBE204 TaxID=1282363 RepID=UPI0003C3D548|nr:STAS/SEC14 domain-containing protein [Asticcacaulis sp. YBE204]ESQ78819.1 hypothetical protein AEYBE204_12615 [Asticcacaulis sp. YBE204]